MQFQEVQKVLPIILQLGVLSAQLMMIQMINQDSSQVIQVLTQVDLSKCYWLKLGMILMTQLDIMSVRNQMESDVSGQEPRCSQEKVMLFILQNGLSLDGPRVNQTDNCLLAEIDSQRLFQLSKKRFQQTLNGKKSSIWYLMLLD